MVHAFRNAVSFGMLILGLSAVAPPVRAEDALHEQRKATKKVAPVYPPIAKMGRLSGTVKMVVVVTPEGTVKTVKTIGGNPVLVPAAEDAAKKWTFEVSKKESSVLVMMTFGPEQ